MNEPNGPRQEELRRDIEHTRAELGATVEALSHKADVKEQARQKKADVQEQARQKKHELQQRVSTNPTPLLIAGGAVALFLVVRMIRRR